MMARSLRSAVRPSECLVCIPVAGGRLGVDAPCTPAQESCTCRSGLEGRGRWRGLVVGIARRPEAALDEVIGAS